MDFTQIIIALIGALFGGGLSAVVTLKWATKKLKFEAKNTEVDYAKNMMETQVNFIVEPLKKEVEKLRRSVDKFTKAFEKISICEYEANCPVRNALETKKEEEEK
ncbi:MAG: hypothetical protein LBN95_05970 [Prevotellaceae bacterium]|jgi:esterase/lipase|nr:hypothetical protein [Prevotellaceae bacterium]